MKRFIIAELKRFVPENVPIIVTVPDDEAVGEYATSVAFALGKLEKRAPMAVAEELKVKLEAQDAGKLFARIDVAKPGFLNFRLTPSALHHELEAMLDSGNQYGHSVQETPKKVQVEFISANPTGPLTLANGRGGFLGDVIANVLEAVGHVVEREYYVNDTGNQVLTLGKSLLAAKGFIPDEETFYKGDYIKLWADAHTDTVTALKDDPQELGHEAAKEFLFIIKSVVEGKAGVLFSRYTSERDDIQGKGYVEKALAFFKTKGVVYEQDGATWLKTSEFGDDKDRVLITGKGEPTYFLTDAGHYLETVERGFDTKVNILGPDHYGYVARIQAAAKLVGLRNSTVIITQAVRLMRGGEEVKMSKRSGTFVMFDELVEEVHPDAARFFFLMLSPDSHLDFDLELAKERSMKNPVFYVQYAYVRIVSVLEKAEVTSPERVRKGGVAELFSAADPSLLSTREDMRLIRKLAEFPDELAATAEDYHVHRLTRYAMELSRTFHEWYEKERVVGEEPALMNARISLLVAAKSVFECLFDTLGISAPEKM
jgi:arginyl-tRNA synthetase